MCARAQRDLPAVRHAARGREDVVPAVALVHLRPLERRMARGIEEDDLALAQQARRIGRHRAQPQAILDAGARARVRVHQIRLPVVVPERTRIDEAAAGDRAGAARSTAPRDAARSARRCPRRAAGRRCRTCRRARGSPAPTRRRLAATRRSAASGRFSIAWPTIVQFTRSRDRRIGSAGVEVKLDEIK